MSPSFQPSSRRLGEGEWGERGSAPPGGLWFTVIYPLALSPDRYLGVPLVVGLSVLETLRDLLSLPCSLKWPNDLVYKGRKLCGILCELSTQGVPALLVGIGLNTNNPLADLPPDVRAASASVTAVLGRAVDNDHLLSECLDRLARELTLFEDAGLPAFLPSILDVLAWRGEDVRLREGDHVSEGTLVGLDESGRLLLNIDGRVESFMTGELRKA